MLANEVVNDIFLCFTLHSLSSMSQYCPATLGTKNYVPSCPGNKSELEIASQRKNCAVIPQNCTAPNNFVYHCLRTNQKKLIEVCSLRVTITFPVCPQFNEGENFVVEDHFTDCSTYTPPCPPRYDSTEAYKYPGCFDVPDITSTTTITEDRTTPAFLSTSQSSMIQKENKSQSSEQTEYEEFFFKHKQLHLSLIVAAGVSFPVLTILCLVIHFKIRVFDKKKRYAKDLVYIVSPETEPLTLLRLSQEYIQETSASPITENEVIEPFYKPHIEGKPPLSSVDLLMEYARTVTYENKDEEECADIPEFLEECFVRKLGVDVLRHGSLVDNITDKEKLASEISVPIEVVNWESDARCRYAGYAKEGTQTRHIATAIIVGSREAGKTLMKGLQRHNFQELHQPRSTVEQGLDVYENIYEIDKDTYSLKAFSEKTEEKNRVLLNVLDFGGNGAYFTCHHNFLSRRAFYVLVINSSKSFDEKVGDAFCNQEGAMFYGWIYGDFIKYWLQLVHLYSDADTPVVILATNEDGGQKKEKECQTVYDNLREFLKLEAELLNHLDRDRFLDLPLTQDDNEATLVEKCLASIALMDRWKMNIPDTWVNCENFLKKKGREKILTISDFSEQLPNGKLNKENMFDVLRFYTEIGAFLNFKKEHLTEVIIPNIQCFAERFSEIITTPKCAVEEIKINENCHYSIDRGYISNDFLNRIWEKKLNVEEIKSILRYMQHLGLIVEEDEAYYVPCLNKLDFGEDDKHNISSLSNKTSVLVFDFKLSPHSFYYRLIAACMVNPKWSVWKYLFKNLACFKFKDHVIVLTLTPTTVQAQIFRQDSQLCPTTTEIIRQHIEDYLITKEYSQRNSFYSVGYQCSEQNVFEEKISCFILESYIVGKGKFDCPQHETEGHHFVHENDLLRFWKVNTSTGEDGGKGSKETRKQSLGKDVVQNAIQESMMEELADLESQIDQINVTMKAIKRHYTKDDSAS